MVWHLANGEVGRPGVSCRPRPWLALVQPHVEGLNALEVLDGFVVLDWLAVLDGCVVLDCLAVLDGCVVLDSLAVLDG